MLYSRDSDHVLQGLFSLILVTHLSISCGNTNEIELRRALFLKRGYDRKVCPELGFTKVHTNLILLQIESVDEKAQVVTSNIQLTCAWCDPYMSWNLSRFNITELSVGSHQLWTPDVVVVNSADGKYSRNREHYAVILRHDGYVRFMFQDLWKTICKVRSTYFPFDRQHCSIIIRSGSHDTQSIKFYQRRPIQGQQFIRGEWELKHSYTEITEERVTDFADVNYSLVRFTLILERNHRYYVIKIILPFTLVSLVTLFTFLLPPQTGEKLTLNVTILLSLVIYLQLLSEYIPKSDDETPVLTLFCNGNFFLVFLSCIMTVYVLYLYHRPPTSYVARVPIYMKIILLDYISPFVYCSINTYRKKELLTKKNVDDKKPRRLSSIEKSLSHIISIPVQSQTTNQQALEVLNCLQQIKSLIHNDWLLPLSRNHEDDFSNEFFKSANQERLDEWQQVALVLDRIFFVLFIVAMPCTALLFHSAYVSSRSDFISNLNYMKLTSTDAKCNVLYKPMLT